MRNDLDLQRHALRLCEFHLPIEVKVEGNGRKGKGWGSTPAIDKYADIVDPNAFKATMGEFMKHGKILLHHDSRKPIGKPTNYEISDKGLWIEFDLATGADPLDHKEQAWNEISQGLLDGLSIGFRIVKDETIDPNSEEGKRGAQRRIVKLRLFEISVVTIPAGEGTWFSVAKGLQFGSDAPFDIYRRGLWPDADVIAERKDALDLYWSGQWPESVRALRSVDPQGAVDTSNEGVPSDSADSAARVVALRARTASIGR